MSREFVVILPPFMESMERAHHQAMAGEMGGAYWFNSKYAITQVLNGFVVHTYDNFVSLFLLYSSNVYAVLNPSPAVTENSYEQQQQQLASTQHFWALCQ